MCSRKIVGKWFIRKRKLNCGRKTKEEINKCTIVNKSSTAVR